MAEANRDIVVVGASAGGVKALSALLAPLPADFPASVFVTMHLAAWHPSALPELINRQASLRARYPLHGDEFAPGSLFVAPPDNHLLVRTGYVHVVRGAKENGHRPSVDALFRSAAKAYGPRVIGVVLTGALDCGTAGLISIKERGGVALVQSPDEAEFPDMPRSAIRHVKVDDVLPIAGLAERLQQLVREPPSSDAPRLDVHLAELEGDEPGVPSPVVCPLCQGLMTESHVQEFDLYRCHTGHAFSSSALVVEQADSVERSLWAALRALQESATLASRMALKTQGAMRERFLERHETDRQNAVVLERIALSAGMQRADGRDALELGSKTEIGADPDAN